MMFATSDLEEIKLALSDKRQSIQEHAAGLESIAETLSSRADARADDARNHAKLMHQRVVEYDRIISKVHAEIRRRDNA